LTLSYKNKQTKYTFVTQTLKKTIMSKLSNKVAIVTGASKGIGASIAKYFAAEGAKVVVNYASSKEGAEKVVTSITENGGTAIAIKADVSKATEVSQLLKKQKTRLDKLIFWSTMLVSINSPQLRHFRKILFTNNSIPTY
jgi:NAD(P)-dependent dehydrogenase (short-subunit alcohol dehydrogenase family)